MTDQSKDPTGKAAPADKLAELRQYVDKRLLSLRADRQSYWTHWRQLSDFLLPRRGRFLVTPNQSTRGDQVGNRIIDSTGTLALRTLAAGLMAGLTSPARPWFRLTMRDADLADLVPVRLWLDEVCRRMLGVFSQSNLYNGLHVVYEELGAFGTGVVLIEEDPDKVIRCQTLTVGEYYLACNGAGEADTLYREYVMTVQQCVDRFGREACSDQVQAMHRSGQLDKEVLVAQAIEPNDDRAPQVLGLKGKPFRSVIWERGQSQTQVMEIKGYHEQPFCGVRWHVVGNDAYGRGPGMDGLGDVRMLQTMHKRLAQAVDKMVSPPMIADVSMKNEPASLLPGGLTFVPNLSATEGFRPAYQINPNIQGLRESILECQKRIQSCFFADLFLMISQLDSVRTATEIVERKQEKMLMLGPFLERSQFELINPVIERTFGIMLRAGLLPEIPREIVGQPFDVECVSTLADAQKSTATTGIERLVAFVGNLAAARQEVLDNIDFDETVDAYAELLGVSPKLLLSDDAVKAIRDNRAKQQARQASALNASAAVQGAQTLSKTDVGGGQNALQRMLGTAP